MIINPFAVGVAPSVEFITGASLAGNRADGPYTVGFRFTIGASSITVTDLGRWVQSGDVNSHAVVIKRVSGLVTMASGTIITSGAPVGAFKYVAVTPVVLTAGVEYFIEVAEGTEPWFAQHTVTSTAVATVSDACYNDGTANGAGCFSYPSFKYQL